ncbi:MAG: hypothetical protein HOH95_04435 [Dehalococcoidia bacterium]|nr:hypothetical protein [Dehalococcoidia bacterium]
MKTFLAILTGAGLGTAMALWLSARRLVESGVIPVGSGRTTDDQPVGAGEGNSQ